MPLQALPCLLVNLDGRNHFMCLLWSCLLWAMFLYLDHVFKSISEEDSLTKYIFEQGFSPGFYAFQCAVPKTFFFSLLLFLFSFFCFNTIASFWNVLSYFKYPALLCCLAMLTSFFAMFLKAFWQLVHVGFEFLMCYLPTFCSFAFLFLFLTRSSSHF